MKLKTRLFGCLDALPEAIYEFPQGLYGFEDLKRFILLTIEGVTPWRWLQSVEDGDIAFLVLDPFLVDEHYSPSLRPNDLQVIGLDKVPHTAVPFCLVIAVVPDDVHRMTVNLRAPLVFNPIARKGIQVILDDDRYLIKHPVFSHGSPSSHQEWQESSELATQPVGSIS